MKVESIQAARAAYDIEAQCILEMKDYFDEVAFSRAVHLLAQACLLYTSPSPRD